MEQTREIKVTAFQPTLPARGATGAGLRSQSVDDDFNPRSPHGERLVGCQSVSASELISTHAPRTGSDAAAGSRTFPACQFQPTLPARGATHDFHVFIADGQFQPTLPARGATRSEGTCAARRMDFNPRSPHGERHRDGGEDAADAHISTHAPRTGSDSCPTTKRKLDARISTHAPRTGSDDAFKYLTCTFQHFNPRSPHGERRAEDFPRAVAEQFQPTLPARGATAWLSDLAQQVTFQPTLPARGATVFLMHLILLVQNFNPRSPHGERRPSSKSFSDKSAYFNPRSPHGERLGSLTGAEAVLHFNPRSPHGERLRRA